MRLTDDKTKRSYCDFHVGSGFLEGVSGVAVDAGARPVDEGHGNVGLDLADPLQHGPLGPAVGDGHVRKRRFSAETERCNDRGINSVFISIVYVIGLERTANVLCRSFCKRDAVCRPPSGFPLFSLPFKCSVLGKEHTK